MTPLPVYRPLRPGDEASLVGLFERLTPEEIRQRFGHAVRALPAEQVRTWCDPDGHHHIAWGVFEPSEGEPVLRGVCRAFVSEGVAEWAIVVEGACTGRGWGQELGRVVLAELDAQGVHQVEAYTAADNKRMGFLARRLGFQPAPSDDATQTRFVRAVPRPIRRLGRQAA